jgi:hypothetical protein
MADRSVTHLEVLTNGVQREKRADSFGKEIHKKLDRSEISNRFQVADVFPEEAIDTFLLPSPKYAGRLS